MKYLIAVRNIEGPGGLENQIFKFKTKKDRKDFIEDLLELNPNTEYATVEMDSGSL